MEDALAGGWRLRRGTGSARGIADEVPGSGSPPVANTYSMLFDGTNEYGNCTDTDVLDGATKATFAFWIKSTTWANIDSIWAKTALNQRVFDIQTRTTNAMYAEGRNTVGDGAHSIVSGNAFGTGTWYCVAVVYDAAEALNDKMKIYRNGSNQPTTPSSVTTWTNFASGSTSLMTIAAVEGPAQNLPAALDEMALWVGQAATHLQILDFCGQGVAVDYAATPLGTPTIWWRMGDHASDSNTLLNDVGSSGTNCTLVNLEAGDKQADVPSL